jgi:hypothetical protein
MVLNTMHKNPEDRDSAPRGEAVLTHTRRLYQALLPQEGVPRLDERFNSLRAIPRKQASKGVEAALDFAVYFPLAIRTAVIEHRVPIVASQKGGNRQIVVISSEHPHGFRSLGAISKAKGTPWVYTAFAVNEQGEVTVMVQNLKADILSAITEEKDFDMGEAVEGDPFVSGVRDPFDINTISFKVHTFLEALDAFQV